VLAGALFYLQALGGEVHAAIDGVNRTKSPGWDGASL